MFGGFDFTSILEAIQSFFDNILSFLSNLFGGFSL